MNVLDKKVGFVSLGCDKNRVDLEKMIYSIRSAGFTIVNDPLDANIIIVNTCAFIKPARVESINTILEMANYKSINLEKLIVTGCINEMQYTDLNTSMPEVDAFVHVSDDKNIVNIIYGLYGQSVNVCEGVGRVLTTPSHTAYVKISEGCDNYCTYCKIPYIRGRFASEKMEDIVREVADLASVGVKEIILVAQDLTRYGEDLYNKPMLVPLIQKISQIDGVEWIKLLYCYPERITDEVIEEISSNSKVCKYIDIPLQHVSDSVLKRMNRRSTKATILDKINKLRARVPDIVIRSTFIVGFPGETDEEYNELIDFVTQQKLNYVGFFEYSKEEGTVAYKMPNQIPAKIKKNRLNYLTSLQKQNTIEYNKSLISKTLHCILDYVDGDMSYLRTSFQVPNADPYVLVHGKLDTNKDFYNVKIVGVNGYDLVGEIV